MRLYAKAALGVLPILAATVLVVSEASRRSVREALLAPQGAASPRTGPITPAEVGAREREVGRRVLRAGALASLACLLALMLLLRRLLAPVRRLAEGAARVARGDFRGRVAVGSSDELAELARGFNEMSASLERTSLRRDFLDTILRAMPDAIIIAEEDGIIRSVNPAASALLGFSEAELLGKPALFLLPEEDRLLLGPTLSSLGEGEQGASLDLALRSSAGGRVPVILSCAVLRQPGGGAPSLLLAAKDISQRKSAELFLDGQARVLQLMLSGAPLPEVLRDISRQVESQSRPARAVVTLLEDGRLRPAAAPSLPEEFLEALAALDPASGAGSAARAARSGAPVLVADEGAWGPLLAPALQAGLRASWSVPFLSSGRSVLGTVDLYYADARGPEEADKRLAASLGGLAALAVERRRAEEELKRSQEGLRQSEKLSAVGRLAAGVAHEINNPLGTILGFAQALMAELGPHDRASLPVDSILREAKRCRTLVSDLLTFSRRSAPRREPVDLNGTVRSTVGLIAARARVSSVSPELDLRAAGRVEGDPGQLQQVIVNLCNNALDAMPAGGRLEVRTRDEDGPRGPRVLLEVQDEGPGVPPELRARIFEPFFTTKEPGHGTGLGLALVHEIASGHGGGVELEAPPGKGALFRVWFPARDGGMP